jgi:hypothetical protein
MFFPVVYFFRDRIYRELARGKKREKRKVWVPPFFILSFSPFFKIFKILKFNFKNSASFHFARWFPSYRLVMPMEEVQCPASTRISISWLLRMQQKHLQHILNYSPVDVLYFFFSSIDVPFPPHTTLPSFIKTNIMPPLLIY